jgi:glutaredoxin
MPAPAYNQTMAAARLTLYTRCGCHLCEEMKAVIDAVSDGCAVQLEEIDIDADPALRAQYDTEVPVLFIDGRKAFKYRVSARELRRRLR